VLPITTAAWLGPSRSACTPRAPRRRHPAEKYQGLHCAAPPLFPVVFLVDLISSAKSVDNSCRRTSARVRTTAHTDGRREISARPPPRAGYKSHRAHRPCHRWSSSTRWRSRAAAGARSRSEMVDATRRTGALPSKPPPPPTGRALPLLLSLSSSSTLPASLSLPAPPQSEPATESPSTALEI